jgi:hypothetical protein
MFQVKSYQYSVTSDGESVEPYIDKIFEHYEQGESNLWHLDPRVINQSSDAFVIAPKVGSKDLQIKISKDYTSLSGGKPNRANAVLDVGIGFSDASNVLQIGSIDRTDNPNAIRITEGTASNSFFLVEMEDAITFFTNKSTPQRSFSHFGYIIKPAFSNDASYGFHGVGFLTHISPDCFNVLRLDGKSCSVKVSQNIKLEFGCITTGIGNSTIELGGRIQPAPLFVHTFISSGVKLRYRTVGLLKYCYKWTPGLAIHQIVYDEDVEQAFIMVGQESQTVGSNASLLTAWEYGEELTI